MHKTKITTTLAALALAAVALAGCTAEPIQAADQGVAASTAPDPTPTPTADDREPGVMAAPYLALADPRTHPKCEEVAWGRFGSTEDGKPVPDEMYGEPIDTGSDSMATGEPDLAPDGTPIAYTVAQGDTLTGIISRFCIMGSAVMWLNGWDDPDHTIYPGDRLLLRPER